MIVHENSIEAYYSKDRNPMRRRCHQAVLDAADGLTVDECRQLLGDDATNSTCAARFSELWHRYGVIEPRGKRRTRSGCRADVFYPVQRKVEAA